MIGAAFLVLGLSWIYAKVHWHRFKQYDYIPRVPPSLVWGHLKKLNEGMSANPDEPDQMLGKVPECALYGLSLPADNRLTPRQTTPSPT